MRSKSAKYRNYTSKKKEIKQNLNAIQFEEPTPTPQNAAYKMIVNHVHEWNKVMNIRYYEHLQEVYDIAWSDISDKKGKTLLETQVKVSEMMTETNKNRKNKAHPTTFEIIPSKNQTLYIIILYHTTNTVLIQGNQKSIWANKEFPILKAVLLHKREHYGQWMKLATKPWKCQVQALSYQNSRVVKPTITIQINKLTLHLKFNRSK